MEHRVDERAKVIRISATAACCQRLRDAIVIALAGSIVESAARSGMPPAMVAAEIAAALGAAFERNSVLDALLLELPAHLGQQQGRSH